MKRICFIKLSFLVLCLSVGLVQAQTSITYQGKLNDGGAAANGVYDFTFRLFSTLSGGTQIGADVVREDVQVTNGTFTVNLDFGATPFTSTTGNFLEISVRSGTSTGAFTPLNPRLPLTTAPYSVKSLNADNSTTATNALNLGGVAASEYVTNTNLGNTVIRNQTTQQSSANFNIQGNGTIGGTLSGNIVNAATEFRMDGFRILGAPTGTANLYAGISAGNTPGTGIRNSAFGYFAGENTNGGSDNSYFGHFAGRFTVGGGNSFFGSSAGLNTLGGNENTFVGLSAGLANTLGSNNTLLGANTNVGANNLSFSTAIGAGATVSTNNTLVLGRNLDTVQIPGSLTVVGTFTGTVSNATTANNALNLGGLAANQYLTTTTANTSFIQNSTTLQASSNFNISGNGTLGGTLFANGLRVYPTSGNGILTFRNRANSNFSQVVFSDDTDLFRGYIGYIGANAGLGARNDTVEFGTNGKDLTFLTNVTEVMRFKTSGRIGIGTTNPAFKFELIDSSNTGFRVQTNTAGGTVASFGSNGTFAIDSVGQFGGRFVVIDSTTASIGGNVGIGTPSPVTKLEVVGTGIVRARVNSDTNAGLQLALGNQSKWSLATLGSGEFQIYNYTTGQDIFRITPNDNLFGIGTTTPTARLDVNATGMGMSGLKVQVSDPNAIIAQFGSSGSFQIDLPGVVGGRFRVQNSGTVEINNPSGVLTSNQTKLVVNGFIRANFNASGITPLCFDAGQAIAACVSSIRFKENVSNFTPGLDLIRRLRPVSFDWKQNGMRDLGLIAEEVAAAEPLLATYSNTGEVQGVKYDRVGVVLVNAVKEQQTQIEAQQKKIAEQDELIKRQATELERQRKELDALKKLVCAANPTAEICKEEQR